MKTIIVEKTEILITEIKEVIRVITSPISLDEAIASLRDAEVSNPRERKKLSFVVLDGDSEKTVQLAIDAVIRERDGWFLLESHPEDYPFNVFPDLKRRSRVVVRFHASPRKGCKVGRPILKEAYYTPCKCPG